ncbi:MAG: hypothetical protein KKG75_03435 [Nanoarchaeota archaeon]|nr:hypothetical protein [Nanoarchaeota archaeon]
MKMKIISLILMFVLLSVSVSGASVVLTYMVDLTIDSRENIVLEDIGLTKSYLVKDFNDGPYTLRMVNFEKETLYYDTFNFMEAVPPAEWFDEEGNQIYFPTEDELFDREVHLVVPYFKTGTNILIYDVDGNLDIDFSLIEYCEGPGCLMQAGKEIKVEKIEFNKVFIIPLIVLFIIGYWLYKKKVK